MAAFYGMIRGAAKSRTSRVGNTSSGLVTTAAAWGGAVQVELWQSGGENHYRVTLLEWDAEKYRAAWNPGAFRAWVDRRSWGDRTAGSERMEVLTLADGTFPKQPEPRTRRTRQRAASRRLRQRLTSQMQGGEAPAPSRLNATEDE